MYVAQLSPNKNTYTISISPKFIMEHHEAQTCHDLVVKSSVGSCWIQTLRLHVKYLLGCNSTVFFVPRNLCSSPGMCPELQWWSRDLWCGWQWRTRLSTQSWQRFLSASRRLSWTKNDGQWGTMGLLVPQDFGASFFWGGCIYDHLWKYWTENLIISVM